MTVLAQRHLDALAEFMNLGAGQAAKALSDMLGVSATLSLPKVDYWRPGVCRDALERAFGPHVDQVVLGFYGPVVGHAAILLEPKLTSGLSELGLGAPAEACDPQDVVAMLEEMGNITLNATMGSLSNVVGVELLYRVPKYVQRFDQNPLFSGTRPMAFARTRLTLQANGNILPGTLSVVVASHVPPLFLRGLDMYFGEGGGDRFLLPGEMVASNRPHVWTTVLGSCVSVCLRHTREPYAAMNHFLLASSEGRQEPGRFGDTAIRAIWEKVSRYDANPKNYRAHIFGGAQMFAFQSFDIGGRNIEMARRELHALGIPVVEERVGGKAGVHLTFDTGVGRVSCRQHRAA